MKNPNILSHWVDLHTHTNKSDGTLSPTQLLELAISIGLSTISITDHDTVGGIEEIISNKSHFKSPLRIIKGIELSAKSSKGTLHILGYNIDINHIPLLESLKNLQKIREERNKEITNKLIRLGIDIGMEDFDEYLENNQSLGRPHIARILLKKKIVDSVDQAFVEYLGKNKKAYVPKELYSAEEAIALIHEAGGFAFIAHPVSLQLEGKEFHKYLNKLIGFGLNGIEVYAPSHNSNHVKFFKQAAKKYNLMISAGSDFHGSVKPTIKLGYYSNGLKIELSKISKRLYQVLLDD